MLANQHTIKTSASISGIGLHTGKQCTLTLVPAPASYGIKFVRTDLDNCPEIPAHIDHVVDVTRGTVLRTNGATVHTVEHVLSALVGMQIDNVRVELTAEEAPVLDGSSKPYVDLIKQVGCVEQSEPKRFLEITDTITYHDAEHGIDIIAVPSDRFRITYMIDYETPMLGTQYTSLYDMQEEFESDFAPARTFCLLSEIKTLLEGNLIKGGRIDNAVVFVDGKLTPDELDYIKDKMHIVEDVTVPEAGIFGGGEMRFPNEPVRHKVMDLIGDLALLGAPIKGHVLVARGGHSSHVELVRLLHKDWQRQQLQEKYQRKATEEFVFDINAIKEILPHRYPFLLVDRILELVPGEWVTGIKNVTVGDHFFQGHFPEYPIMPGVLIVEAMGQVGGVLLLNMESQPSEKLVYFTGFDKVKFRHQVRPGDQLYIRVEMTFFRRGICRMKGRAFVGERLAAEAEMQAVMVDKEK